MVVHGLEVAVCERAAPEADAEVPVQVFGYLFAIHHVMAHLFLGKQGTYLLDLVPEIILALAVVHAEGSRLYLLCDDETGLHLRVLASAEEVHVCAVEELGVLRDDRLEGLSAENVLFLERVSVSEILDDVLEERRRIVVFVDVGRILDDGVVHANEHGVMSFSGIGYPYPVLVFLYALIESVKLCPHMFLCHYSILSFLGCTFLSLSQTSYETVIS